MEPPGSFWSGSSRGNNHGDEDEGPSGGNGQFPGRGFPFSFDHDVNQMFRHFEEMFKNFGLADFGTLDVPGIGHTPSGEAGSSPRDHMLKEPDLENKPISDQDMSPTPTREPMSWFDALRKGRTPLFNPPGVESQPSSSKKDSDLDDIVRQGEVDRIFGSRSDAERGSQQPELRTFSRTVSIHSIRRPDGTIETRRTEQDEKGTRTTTVTSRQGGEPALWGQGQRKQAAPSDPWWGGVPTDGEAKDHSMFHNFFGSWFKK